MIVKRGAFLVLTFLLHHTYVMSNSAEKEMKVKSKNRRNPVVWNPLYQANKKIIVYKMVKLMKQPQEFFLIFQPEQGNL